jgi:hypothetical protein
MVARSTNVIPLNPMQMQDRCVQHKRMPPKASFYIMTALLLMNIAQPMLPLQEWSHVSNLMLIDSQETWPMMQDSA